MSKLTVKCPNCQKIVPWNSQSTYRPFCSERCRLIDLGEWADGKSFEDNFEATLISIGRTPDRKSVV